MMLKSKLPSVTYSRLRHLLSYCPETGLWMWIAARPGVAVGSEAGTFNKVDRYRRIMIDGRLYLAHVLAWFYMTGKWPVHEIDHRDADRCNGRWKNLREATHAQNQWNSTKRRDNTSGFKGVHWHSQHKKWQARLAIKGKRESLGLFDCRAAAHFAVVVAADKHHQQFARVA